MIVAKLYFSFSITDCKYTCHRRCRDEVDLDCTGGWQLERNLSVDEMSMKTLHLINQVFLIQYTSCFVLGCGEIIKMLIKKASVERSCLPVESSSPETTVIFWLCLLLVSILPWMVFWGSSFYLPLQKLTLVTVTVNSTCMYLIY